MPFVVYHQRFLLWWGLALFLCKLGSRRPADYPLNTDGPAVLADRNRLAGTRPSGRPVNKTLNYFLGRIGTPPVARLRAQCLRRLVRMQVLDSARLQGRFVVAADGTGYLVFRYRHGEHCLTQRHGATTRYLHPAPEAKLLGPADTVFSLGTEVIDNRDLADTPAGAGAAQRPQDGALKALRRLAAGLRAEFPQRPVCLSGDGRDGCGEGFPIAQDYRGDLVYTFQPGRLPAWWQAFPALRRLAPERRVERRTPAGVRPVYRGVPDRPYTDSRGREWLLKAIPCHETSADGTAREWSWLTGLDVRHATVVEVATQGGRQRWHIESQGLNVPKNSGRNREHASSHGVQWAAYSFLLPIAHRIRQRVEKGSLRRQLARQQGQRTAVAWFGSLKNRAQRLLESLRDWTWPAAAFDAAAARRRQIRLDSS